MVKGRSSKAEGAKLAMMAVALQDHITRSVPQLHGLSMSNPPRKKTPSQRVHRGRRAEDTHRENGQRGGEEKEYVLDLAAPPLTLAQRLGLMAALSRRLSDQEWTEVKSRSLHEGDVTQPCVICREEFRLQPQVLLSCSHVFHKVCLRSFERFSGRKCCPMCRREQYETRVIYDGARLYREKCAVRIQACWRGYAARKWYRKVRRLVPPKDPHLRRQFFEEKFKEMNDSLVQSCCSDVEEFLHDIDRSMAASRDIFCRFKGHCNGGSETEDEQWLEAQEKAIRRDVQDCPICLTSLSSSSAMVSVSRQVLLLSCSHLFHEACLQAFERFCLDSRPTCPLCRCHYTTVAM